MKGKANSMVKILFCLNVNHVSLRKNEITQEVYKKITLQIVPSTLHPKKMNQMPKRTPM